MSGQVTILQLPTASALTGTESVPVVQNGVTVQTTTGAISGAGALNYPFLTVNSTAGLTQARYLATGSGLSVTDNGAGSTLQINLTGAAQSLDNASTGLLVKTGTTTISNTAIAVGSGMTIANPDATTGNPTIGLNSVLQNFASLSGTGILAINGTSVGPFTLQGVANQIAITNGNALTGTPTVGIATNPTLPGTGYVQLPSGGTAQRGFPTYGAIRYNSDTQGLEAYTQATGWGAIISGAGVSTFSGGSTGLTPNTPTSGAIILSGTLNVANGGTGAATLTGYLVGNGTSPITAVSTIPNAGLTNSSVTYNGVSVALGASGTITAANPNALTIGTGLTGTSYNGSSAVTIAIDSTVATLTGTQTLTNKTISGSTNTLTNIGNSSLTNSSLTVNGTSISLGGSATVTATTTNALTIGTGLSGTSFNGSAPVTIAISNTGVTSGTYGSASVIPVIQVNSQGQITSVSTQAINSPTYQGTWNASTNTPTLTSSVGTQSYYYVVSVAGNTTLNGVSGWNVGDWAIFTGGVWEKVPGSSSESFTNLTTTNLAVTGLTGYMYANGSSNVTASSTIPTSALTGTLGISNGGTGQTTASAAFNALSPITSTGDLIIGNGTNSATRLGIGANGYVLTSNGSTASWQASTGGVTSFSAGTTGFTPSTGTTGAVTLSGTLNVANGGTGVTSSSGANSVVLRDSNGNIVWNNEAPGYTNTVTVAGTTTLTASATRYQHFSGTSTQTLKLPDETTIPTAMGYIVDNDSTGNVTVQDSAGNTLATAVPGGAGWIYSLSNASATGNWAGYLLPPGNSATAPLTWGTAGLNMASSYIQGITTLNMSGQLTNTVATGTAPFAVSSTTQVANLNAATAGTATNVTATAGSGSTNYIHFSSSATGNVGVNTNSSLTYNYTNNALTAGINGGTF